MTTSASFSKTSPTKNLVISPIETVFTYTPEYQKLYGKRKETIERVFADAKEKHAMRYTQYRGLIQVTNCVKLKFAAMNVKKLATWKWNDHFYSLFFAFSALNTPETQLLLYVQPGFSTG